MLLLSRMPLLEGTLMVGEPPRLLLRPMDQDLVSFYPFYRYCADE